MSESGGVNGSSSLAIVEKKPQRSGGCVGIFFQLFDWNRRFAKKKLFSKKLLPPARAKQAAKKFGGDEKQPKLRLIADENSGGFPNAKKNGVYNVDSEQKQGVKTPSLVARLMGLEAMPVVQQKDKLKKVSSSGRNDKGGNVTSGHYEFGMESQESEKGDTKHEVRPPKLQKTGLSEKHSMTKYGTETLHFKNVLSRSRKPHHPKLLSPVKSPRKLSGMNSSRLMGAATKILEPGLQSRNRAKSALTYSHNVQNHTRKELMSESMKPTESFDHCMNDAKSLKGQSSCKNCANLIDVIQGRLNIDDLPSVNVPSAPSTHMSQQRKSGVSLSSLEQENEGVSRKYSASLAAAVDNIRNHANFTSDKIVMMPQTSTTSIGYKQMTQRQNERPNYQQNNRFMSASNAVSQTKDFVALNRSLSGQTRPKMYAQAKDSMFESERKFINKREDLSQGRKRRSMNVSKAGESSRFVNSTLDKPRYIDEDGSKDCAPAFTFNSPMKHRSEITSKGVRRDQNVSTRKSTQKKTLPYDTNGNGKSCFQKPFPLTGDTLADLLDLKLKEVTTERDYEQASILQELISALTTEKRPPQKKMNYSPYATKQSVSKYHVRSLNLKTDLRFQGMPERTAETSFGFACDDDHLSPGCVLEASFSNDSCLSSSLEDSYGHMLHDAMSSYDEPHHIKVEPVHFHSGVPLNNERTSREFVVYLLNFICEVLYNIDLSEGRLKGNKLNHAKEVIFNAELVLGHTSLTTWYKVESFSVSKFLLDELETLASVFWSNFGNLLHFEDTEEGNLLSGFIFDCLIEYLDSTYVRYSKSRFGAWASLPFCMNAEKMIYEVVEEVKGWMSLTELTRDELIEKEMSRGLGKWTNFEIQAFETSVDIEWMILHSLVDEVVFDLYELNIGF